MAATDIKHIHIKCELLISLLMVLGILLEKCFKLLLQGKDPVAQMRTGGSEQKEKRFFSFYPIIIYQYSH